ncbi:hypothetical protein ACR78F_12840 [Sphingobacterium spiritivorum]|uniref:Uncharacterized protein n=1 Tax=Sphingobacterium spiritivorum ATCC 33861 TaxID=525373 RepID=D7VMY7_SPHSI|nr:hypothetical protein [Sphingobacterium spiritivorum]EFK57284.1 hypothetical protein HMPREF0766_12357 [Sphingobacterium spiritivorum ATCC 33861]QQT36632.1 hypothetical protein I6J01_04145 [Sphingobacterium spiritivorum]WQD33384.1 hypothetical protein U0038_17855 [Sphingobacterium spiritivorum]SUJ22879.1 Uncharacterised protein [Sphingobacterium spiritivorum]
MTKNIRYFILLLVVGLVLYGVHYAILKGLDLQDVWQQTDYKLWGFYLVGGISSLVMLIVVIIIHNMMPNSVGFVFLGLLTLKMIVSFLYVNKGLNQQPENFIEYNFLAVFFLFIVYDVFMAYKVMNQENKQ